MRANNHEVQLALAEAGEFPGELYLEHNIPAFDLEWDGAEELKVSHTDETKPELVDKY